jgi:hypothetical protein
MRDRSFEARSLCVAWAWASKRSEALHQLESRNQPRPDKQMDKSGDEDGTLRLANRF